MISPSSMSAKTLFLKISVPTGPLVPSNIPAWFWAAVVGQRHQLASMVILSTFIAPPPQDHRLLLNGPHFVALDQIVGPIHLRPRHLGLPDLVVDHRDVRHGGLHV